MADKHRASLLSRAEQEHALADEALRRSRYKLAAHHFRSAADCASAAQARATWDDDNRPARLVQAKSLEQLSYALGRLWKLREALEASDGAMVAFLLLDAGGRLDDVLLGLACALNSRGEVLTRLERLTEAQESHDRALALLAGDIDAIEDASVARAARAEQARSLIGRGNSLADRGRFNSASADYQRVIDDYRCGMLDDRVLAARAATNLGNVKVELGERSAAAKHFEFSTELLAGLPPESAARIRPMLAHTLRCHGQACFLEGELDEAVRLGHLSIDIFRQLCDHLGVPESGSEMGESGAHHVIDLVKALSVVGRAYTRAGRLKDAESIHDEAVARLSTIGALAQYPRGVQALCQVDLGNALADQGRHDDAIAHYSAAIKIYWALVRQGRSQYIAGLCRARTNLGNVLLAEGDSGPALDLLTLAERHYSRLIDEAEARPLRLLIDRVHARICRARAQFEIGSFEAARMSCEISVAECIAMLPTAPLAKVRASFARGETLLARIYVAIGNLEEARKHGESAGEHYTKLLQSGGSVFLLAEWAECSSALGYALTARGELDKAERFYIDALAVYQELANHRSMLQYVPELARVETNLGNAYRWDGNVQAAISHHKNSVRRLRGAVAAQPRLNGQRGHAALCLGVALQTAGRVRTAERFFGAIVALLSVHAGGAVAHETAMASALSRRGRLRMEKRDLLQRALEDLKAARGLYLSLARGSIAQRIELMHVHINIALVHERTGQVEQARKELDTVWNVCWAAANGGSSAMANPGLRAFRERLRLRWMAKGAGISGQDLGHHADDPQTQEMLEELECFAKLHLDLNRGHLRALDLFTRLLIEVRPRREDWDGNVKSQSWAHYDRLMRICLEWTCLLARDADPAWLCDPTISRRLQAVIDLLQRLAVHRDPLVADWYIHCFALRSSRQLLREGDDPDARALAKRLDEHDRFSWQLFSRFDDLGDCPHDPFRNPSDDKDDARGSSEWRRTRTQMSQHFARCLALEDVESRLREISLVQKTSEALVLLCLCPARQDSLEPSSLWIIVVRHPSEAQSGTFHRVGVQRCILSPAAMAALTPQDDDGTTGGSNWDYSCVSQQVAAALRVWLCELRDKDNVGRITLIPSPGLCRVPWHLMIDQGTGTDVRPEERFRVYPSIRAWWGAREVAHLDKPAREDPGRIAVVSCDAWRETSQHRWAQWLPGASCEAAMGRRLWNGRIESPTHMPGSAPCQQDEGFTGAAETLDGLILSGHGVASADGSWHESGVLHVGESGRPELLTGQWVNSLGDVRQVFVNACVLGRTRSFLGESFGMFATLFHQGASVRTAIGAVRDIGDFEAMLISLAFQYALHARMGSDGRHERSVDWASVFVQVQRELHAGRWPAGFADWFEASLPAVLCSRDVVSDDNRREGWYAVLCGDGIRHDGLFSALGLETMSAGLYGDWGKDLQRLAKCIAQGVPQSVSDAVRCYIVLGE